MRASQHAAGAVLRSVNPATLEPVGSVAVTSPEALAEVLVEARLAQESWARAGLEARSALLRRVAACLLDDLDALVAVVTAETGKPLVEALSAEAFVALDALRWLARNVRRVVRPSRVPLRQPYLWHKRAWLRYDPVGVVGIVGPWNFPFAVPFTQAAAAVAAGNAAVVKPSELTPLSGFWVERLFRRAGAPPGLVRVVQGRGETVGDALVAHRGVDAVVFTGSTEVGRHVAVRCAERLCPVTLELGGKDPMLVLDDADLDRAVAGALWGAFGNCGQVCSGVERVYVAAELHDAFVDGLARSARRLRLGRGDDPAVDLGPLISSEALERVESLVDDALRRGAVAVTGGARAEVHLPGHFFAPTVLVDVPAFARVEREEVFGPVVTVASIENDADGIRRANDSSYALGASVWTRDRRRARRVAAQLEAGSVWTNDCAYSYGAHQAPWGGRGQSGHGRTHGRHGLLALSHVTYVDADAGRLTPPWWYPYDAVAADGLRSALSALHHPRVARRTASAWRRRRELAALAGRALGR